MNNCNEKNDKAKNGSPFTMILGFLIILILFCFCYYFLNFLREIVSKSISKLDAVVIVALITGTVSIITMLISKIVDYKNKRQEYLTQKREEPYSELVKMYYKMIRKNISDDIYTDADMNDDINKFSEKLTLWGSKEVIEKWNEFRKNSMVGADKVNNLFIFEDVMNVMRKDLGQKKVKKGDLLSFNINDIDNYLKK